MCTATAICSVRPVRSVTSWEGSERGEGDPWPPRCWPNAMALAGASAAAPRLLMMVSLAHPHLRMSGDTDGDVAAEGSKL